MKRFPTLCFVKLGTKLNHWFYVNSPNLLPHIELVFFLTEPHVELDNNFFKMKDQNCIIKNVEVKITA